MPDDKQQTVDWQNDPDFHALPLVEKHKVLLQVDPDYKGLPAKEQVKALDAIHYGTLGQISGTGELTQGLGKSVAETLKSQLPSLTPRGILGAIPGAVGLPSPEHAINAWEETKAGYQRGGLPEAIAAGAAAASPFAVSGSQMAEAAKHGESGKILGQAAVPAAEAALAYAAPKIGRAAGKVRGAIGEGIHTPEGTLKTGPELASRAVGGLGGYFAGEALGGGNLLGEYVGAGAGARYAPKVVSKLFPPRTITPPPPVPPAEPIFSKVSEGPGPYRGPASVRKSSMKPPPPSPFAPTATSSAMPIGNAPLPEVPQGSPTPFPTVQPKVKAAAAGVEAAPPSGTSVLSRAKTPIELGVEPDMNNPAHVKMINDIIGQGLNEAAIKKLKVRADLGDRFAAVALNYWRSKMGQ